ncbi:MAG: Holliday junction resolvase RuvX [Eubacteriales bacterium]|jgi:putative Holliday junction resolvase
MEGKCFMRIMALDVGDKRIGVALSDADRLTSQPHCVIERRGEMADLAAIMEIVQAYDVSELVVGNPMNMDGSRGDRSRKTEKFYNFLKKRVGIQTAFFDERLTTAAAERVLMAGDVSRKKRKEVIDKLAAQQILYTYLDYIKRRK